MTYDAAKGLVHTHWSSLSDLPDGPEHYQEVTYELRDVGGATELRVSETNMPNKEAETVSRQ